MVKFRNNSHSNCCPICLNFYTNMPSESFFLHLRVSGLGCGEILGFCGRGVLGFGPQDPKALHPLPPLKTWSPQNWEKTPTPLSNRVSRTVWRLILWINVSWSIYVFCKSLVQWKTDWLPKRWAGRWWMGGYCLGRAANRGVFVVGVGNSWLSRRCSGSGVVVVTRGV